VVAATDRPGMVVRSGPFGGSFTRILDDQIVTVRADRQVAISRDRGRSWRLVDLRLPASS
jgi:hypothetical protein